jgi:hypothetical protein
VCVADGSLLSDVAYVLCLDTIGNDNKLHLHVSKPPKPGSAGEAFYQVPSFRRDPSPR